MSNRIARELSNIQPEGWARAKGLSYGIMSEGRAHLCIAGQLAGETGAQAPSKEMSFVEQFSRCLQNVVTVVESAGGKATDIAALRVFVTDMTAFKTGQPHIAEAWRRILGRHFPAMTMVEVSALFEETALVEIEGTALLQIEG